MFAVEQKSQLRVWLLVKTEEGNHQFRSCMCRHFLFGSFLLHRGEPSVSSARPCAGRRAGSGGGIHTWGSYRVCGNLVQQQWEMDTPGFRAVRSTERNGGCIMLSTQSIQVSEGNSKRRGIGHGCFRVEKDHSASTLRCGEMTESA